MGEEVEWLPVEVECHPSLRVAKKEGTLTQARRKLTTSKFVDTVSRPEASEKVLHSVAFGEFTVRTSPPRPIVLG